MSTSTTAALQGTGSGSGSSISSNHATPASPPEDLHFSSSQLLALHDSKDDAMQVLKSDLMDELNKEVKSLDEDSWMYEGPRSRINLISKTGSSFLTKNGQSLNKRDLGLPS